MQSVPSLRDTVRDPARCPDFPGHALEVAGTGTPLAIPPDHPPLYEITI